MCHEVLLFFFFEPCKNAKTILSTWATHMLVLAGVGPQVSVASLCLKKGEQFFQLRKVYARSQLHLCGFLQKILCFARCIFKASFLKCRPIIVSLITHFLISIFQSQSNFFLWKDQVYLKGISFLVFILMQIIYHNNSHRVTLNKC